MLSRYKFPDITINRAIVRLATIVIKDGESKKDTLNYLNYISRAHAYRDLGKSDLAISDLAKASEQAPGEYDILLEKAAWLAASGKIELAAADYLLVIDRITRSGDEFYRYKSNQAFVDLRRIAPETATELLKTNDPREKYQKLYDSAYTLVQNYNNKDAGTAKQILEFLTASSYAYASTGVFQDTINLLRAITYKKGGQYPDAIAYYKDLAKNDDKFLSDLAAVYQLAGMKKEMLDAYEKAFNAAGTNTEKARIKQEWNEAKEMDLDPLLFAGGLSKENKTAYRQIIQRGLIEFANGNNKVAIAILDSAISLNPIQSRADLYKAIIICKENYNSYKYSETYIQSSKLINAIAERTNWPDAWYFSGKFYFEQYTSWGRIKCYDKAIALTGGKYEDALYERFREYDISCDNCESKFDRSGEVDRDKQLRTALADFYAILKLTGDKPAKKELYYYASNIYATINRYDSAVILYKKYMQLKASGYGNDVYHLAHLQALKQRVATTAMDNIIKSEKLNKEAEALIKDNYQGYDIAKFQQAIDADKLNPAPLYTLGKFYYLSDWADTWDKVNVAKMTTAYNYFRQVYNIDSGYQDVRNFLRRAKYQLETAEAWGKLKTAPSTPRDSYSATTNSAEDYSPARVDEPLIVCPECKGKGISLHPGGIKRAFLAQCGMCGGTGIRWGW